MFNNSYKICHKHIKSKKEPSPRASGMSASMCDSLSDRLRDS